MYPFIQAAKHGPASNLPVTRIVIHGTVSPCRDGQARATAAYFQTVKRSASAHYVVDPSEIVQCVSEATIAYHAPPNQHSIGIELCDPQTGSGARWADPAHEAMLARAAALVRTLCAKHNIPIVKLGPSQLVAGARGICGHVDVTNAWHQTTHVDPGPDFPWAHFLTLVRSGTTTTTSQAGSGIPNIPTTSTTEVEVVTPEDRAAIAKDVTQALLSAGIGRSGVNVAQALERTDPAYLLVTNVGRSGLNVAQSLQRAAMGVDVNSLAAAVAAALPDKPGGLTKDDVTNAVRAVFADASQEG